MRVIAAPILVLVAMLVAPSARVAAQVTTVDKGSFTITRQGAPAGREEFEIRSLPAIDGSTLEARGTVTLDGRSIHPTLSTSAGGSPLSYRVEVRTGTDVVERATGQVTPGRLRVDAQSAGGRSAREFVIGDGMLVLDDAVFHQYYFLARRAAGSGAVTVVVPRRNVQVALRVTPGGSERVTVGGRELAATRLAISEPGAGERSVWVDAEGRVLKVAVPSQGLVAQRDEPPA